MAERHTQSAGAHHAWSLGFAGAVSARDRGSDGRRGVAVDHGLHERAGLLLARSAARASEMGIRLALGASRWRVARQLLSESLPLALLGGFAGMVLTYACLPLLAGALPSVRDRAAVLQPLAVHLEADLRVLAFAVAVTLLSTLLFNPCLSG